MISNIYLILLLIISFFNTYQYIIAVYIQAVNTLYRYYFSW